MLLKEDPNVVEKWAKFIKDHKKFYGSE